MNTLKPSALAALALCAIALTGCSVGFAPSGAPAGDDAPKIADAATGADAAPGADAADAAPGDTGTASTTDDASEGSSGADGTLTELRAQMRELANTISCPGGTLEITEDVAVVALDGPCDTLTISANTTTVFADEVGDLVVSGTVNTVWAESVKTVTVTGDTNTIEWMSGSPVVVDKGTVNSIGLMKGK